MAFSLADDLTPCLFYSLSCLKKEGLKLKKEQVEAISLVSSGKDVFLWLPTGFGKSICYQSLPFVFDHKLGKTSAPPDQRSIVLVVSPLVSLMVDQVTYLQSAGVGAAILSGNKGVDKSLLATEGDVIAGKFCLLISAPEAVVSSDGWRELLLQEPLSRQIVAVTVHEAHCVYKWYIWRTLIQKVITLIKVSEGVN